MVTNNPYRKLPRRAFWSTSVERAARNSGPVPDLWRPAFEISQSDPVITTGSCFAQHISTALVRAGFQWVQAERPPFGLNADSARKFGYGIFSVRTGNIYTTRMLVQWLSWAIDPSSQDREVWEDGGAFFDPVRPQIEPGGFEDEDELFAARQTTLAALRKAISESSVFIFTLGLTEQWENSQTGLVYSACPGTVGGTFDSDLHHFRNIEYSEILADLESIRQLLHLVNPDIRLLLTVSPVPLVATAAEGQHVLTATTYSKSVLRAAAGAFCAAHANVDYFPSYEIVTTPALGRQMFDSDRRSVLPEAVSYVMQHFLAGLGLSSDEAEEKTPSTDAVIDEAVLAAQEADEIVCEEIELERFNDDND